MVVLILLLKVVSDIKVNFVETHRYEILIVLRDYCLHDSADSFVLFKIAREQFEIRTQLLCDKAGHSRADTEFSGHVIGCRDH